MQTNLYVGAYVEIKVKEIEEFEIKSMCENCKKEVGSNFCSVCGKPVIKTKVSSKSYPDLWDILGEKFEDVITETNWINEKAKDNIIRAIGNNINDLSEFGIDTDDDCHIEITSDKPKEFIENFKRYYQVELDHLRKHIDVVSIEVKFGVIFYYS